MCAPTFCDVPHSLSAIVDIGLGIFALTYSPVHSALGTELVQGYEIGVVVCSGSGAAMCGLSLFPLVCVRASEALVWRKRASIGDGEGACISTCETPGDTIIVGSKFANRGSEVVTDPKDVLEMPAFVRAAGGSLRLIAIGIMPEVGRPAVPVGAMEGKEGGLAC